MTGPSDLQVVLTRRPGWYSVDLTLGPRDEVTLRAAVNPPQPFSLITIEALDALGRWELIPLAQLSTYRLTSAIVQGQSVPDFDVRPVPLARPFQWDVIIGANFFANYSEIHLDLRTSRARITRGRNP